MPQQQKQESGLLTSLLLMVSATTAVADSAATLPTVVIAGSGQPASHQNLTHLDEEDLIRSGQRELNKVIEGLVSVNTPHGMKGGFTLLTLRGAGGGVGLVNIDGIPLHMTIPGALSLDLFPAETFGSADIVRGSGAMLSYGRTLGGVINLRSRDADQDGGRLHVEGGSFGSLQETGSVSLAGHSARINLVAGRDDVLDGTHWADPREGNPERDRFHAHQFGAHLVSEPGDRLRLDGSLYYSNSDTEVDKPGLRPTGRYGIIDDRQGRLGQELWLTQATARVDIRSDWQTELQLGYTQHRLGALVDGRPTGFLDQLTLVRWKNTHRLGSESGDSWKLQIDWGGEGLYEEGTAHDGRFHGRRGTGSGNFALHADWGRWSGVAVVRADHYDDYGGNAVFHAGSNLKLSEDLNWYLSGGTVYRPPSFNERLIPFYGNPNLRPEKGASGETGFRWNVLDDTSFTIGYFYNRFDDLIQDTFTPAGFYVAENVPHARIQGLESQWSTRWDKTLTAGIDYTWTRAENLDTRKPLARNPEHVARFWAEWKADTLPITLWGQGVFRGPSFDSEGQDRIADAFYLDLQLSYQIAKPFNVYLRGENLTGNTNPQALGRGMPGAAVYGGFRLAIGD